MIYFPTIKPFIRRFGCLATTEARRMASSAAFEPKSHGLRKPILSNTKRISRNVDSQNKQLFETLSKFLKVKPVVSITTAEAYDLPHVIDLLHRQGYQPSSIIPNEIVSFNYFHEGQVGEVMIISQNGTIVSWGFDESCNLKQILPLVEEARVNPLKEEQFESEDMDYVELESETQWKNLKQVMDIGNEKESLMKADLLIISKLSGMDGILDKAAFSGGMSRSTRLAVLESALESLIKETRDFSESLSKGAQLKVTESAVLRSTGRLFLIRGKLNLYSELIETPDLYWSEPVLEKLYIQVSRHLDIPLRISILNKKLDYASDESRAMMSVLNEKKSTRLEWIIIYLIAVEVCIELYHFYEKSIYSNRNSNEAHFS
ncbi:HBR289Wp [Eremothecium sinecaudum]|uniref:HBR289Wp n=1 Tax=Eremothecium sinecaudum TaxID=45286 RepID=A0A109UX97_9SACH|nr:HBR289Wp [Eremothecium sinecaudum]AMD19190.1 HBR289Wp [Eremothecium sinecaudum]